MALEGGYHNRESVKLFSGRLLLAMWLTGFAFILLISRLYSLQILRGDELDTKGRRNFVQRVRVLHDRGIIYDRHGRILADNRPTLDAQVRPHFLGDKEDAEQTLEQLATIIEMTPDELDWARETVLSKRGLDRFQPIVVKRDLTPAQVEAVEAQRSVFSLDGVDVVEGRRRTYPYGPLAPHLLGYVREIGPHKLEYEKGRGNPLGYRRGDLLGRFGVEQRYEADLRGTDGYEQVVVDAKGRRIRTGFVQGLLSERGGLTPRPGNNVFLTIDADLQAEAEFAFNGRAGSVVALDPRTGAVLALVSEPGFDPNLISGALGPEEKARLDDDPLKVWVNRAIQGQYAPGSTFKIITSFAALNEGITNPNERIRCPGYYRMGRHTWRCHKLSGHGMVDLKDALKVSCDTYYYTMAGRMGIDPIAAVGRDLGLGGRTTIPLRGEQPGLMPDEAFHDRVDKKTGGYQKGMSVNTSIGQGSVLMTPLQLAVAYAAVANGGTVYQPQVVARVETPDFRVIKRAIEGTELAQVDVEALENETPQVATDAVSETVEGQGPLVVSTLDPKGIKTLKASPEFFDAVREGLIAVAQEPGGTAYYRRSKKVSMAGKTGTAQVVRMGAEKIKDSDKPWEHRDHAWFVAYAPVEDPRIVVAVLNEHSGHGSSAAAPIAVKVIDAWYDKYLAEAAPPAPPVEKTGTETGTEPVTEPEPEPETQNSTQPEPAPVSEPPTP